MAGQQAAIEGLPFQPECVDLGVERPTLPHLIPSGFEGVMAITEAVTKGLVAGIGSAILAVVELCEAESFPATDPENAISRAAAQLADTLTSMGITDSMELFVGGGIDMNVAECELKLTPIFRTIERARQTAQAMGRPHFVVVGWRTDASGGVMLADSD